VCDLPYGVQHGSTPPAGALQRSPDDLLVGALPVWRDVLKPGAGAALAWNLRTLDRARLVELLVGAGLELVTPADDQRFVHRVDRSITRDVVVARRPAAR
jgi:tRNA G10  N-methylase Trm11